MKSAVHTTDWEGLADFANVIPLLARLTNGGYVILVRAPALAKIGSEDSAEQEVVAIFNPRAPEASVFPRTREEFEEHWTGEIVLLKRIYKLTDVNQPFGLRWFIPEFLRQRTLFGNIALAAMTMHVLALAVPIFFQLVIDRVLVYQSVSTLAVIGTGVV
ncbi:MAG: peptidase domain-containing ABC transporter, partial [Alphaproteobacteria bacterium]